jgi:hypothetical protein
MKPIKNILTLLTFLFMPLAMAFARGAAKANETLLQASSPFEDMAEFALAGNDASITKSLAAADSAAAHVRDALPTAAHAQFDTLLQAIHKAATAREHHAVAANAVEVFRLLIDHLDAGSLKVPNEVSLLDYAGFKLHVLAAAPQPDWEAIRRTVKDAGAWWDAIESKVSDKGLHGAFHSTVVGLQQAGKTEHLPMLNFAAQMDLDLVDLLEGHFERKK